MATAVTAKQGNPIGSVLFTVTETSTGATAVNLDNTSGSIIMVEIDNTANSAATFLSLWDAGAATPGSTDEDFAFMCPASSRVTYACPDGCAYGTGLTAALVTGVGSATGPKSTATAYILAST